MGSNERDYLKELCYDSKYAVAVVPGLCYIPNYCDTKQSEKLIKLIDNNQWNTDLKRRTQHYGFKYDYTSRTAKIKADPIPNIIKLLQPFKANQVIINEYEPGQGIGAHTDHVKVFDNPIATLSLLSSIPMIFKNGDIIHTLILEPHSMVVMIDEARYKWTHSIAAKIKDNGIPRSRRVSITYRRLK